MEELMRQLVQRLLTSAKESPYIWSAIGCTLLIGLQVVLAVVVLNGDEATVRRQLTSLQRLDVGNTTTKGQPVTLHPVKSCAPIALEPAQLPNSPSKYENCYMIAAESTHTDGRGYTIWNTLDQQTKPAMSRIKTEIWTPRKDADNSDPLVKAGGCILLSFPDPAVPEWLQQMGRHTRSWLAAPQVACILPLEPTLDEVQEHKLTPRLFKHDGEPVKGLDMDTLPAVSDILPRLRTFLGYPDRQGLTIFKPS
ncbi:hypothetical protein F66182_2190 [Fusarium sp. NRRL 66182]|nr:hypothetical protein F66182_2190 [Fusarium sp. NRRL 66182]